MKNIGSVAVLLSMSLFWQQPADSEELKGRSHRTQSQPTKRIDKAASLGTRQAATALLNGSFPKSWLRQAGGNQPPDHLQWPIPGRRLARGFEADQGRHAAVDITAPIGTQVQAMAPGLVAYADDGVKGYGRAMMLLHAGGWVTLYGHLSNFKAKIGRFVQEGQVIALTGNTGISRGPHLHFAMFVRGQPVDPMKHMRGQPERAPRIALLDSLLWPFSAFL